jgi:hypothetical protein
MYFVLYPFLYSDFREIFVNIPKEIENEKLYWEYESLSKKTGIKTGKRNSISISDDFKTLTDRVFAAGDVTNGETLIVKAMEKGREASQRVHEFLMNLESSHMSFYERYYENLSYDKKLKGEKEVDRPPD